MMNAILKKAAAICGAAVMSLGIFTVNTFAAEISSNDIYNSVVEKIGDNYPNRRCLQFVESLYQDLGGDRNYDCCASRSGDNFIVSTSMDNIPIGATVYFTKCGGGPCSCGNTYYGHVGVYIGEDMFVHATGGKVLASSLSDWASMYRGYGYCGGFDLTDSQSSNDPFGYLDYAGLEGNNTVRVRGWTFDADDYSQNLDIHIYWSKPACEGEAHVGTANTYRPDVDQVFSGSGKYHGFDITFKPKTNLTGKQKLYVYALNAKNTGGENVLLGEAEVDMGGGAAEIDWPITSQQYMVAYTISNGNNTAAYSGSDLEKKIGTIYASDDLRVYSIDNNTKTAYVSYPISGGRRKYAYIPLSVIAGSDRPCAVGKASSSIKTYNRPSGSRVGCIYGGDTVYKIAESGKYTQVVYNVGDASDPSCYRMAWILTSAYNSYVR